MQALSAMRLLSCQPGTTDYAVWEQGLLDIKPADLARGVLKARDHTGWLSLGDFRLLCRATPADLGLPDSRTAMREAACAPMPKDRYAWSHAAVYLTACNVGWYDMQHKTEAELFPIWDAAYAVMCRRVLDGETLTMPIPKALPATVHVPLPPEAARSRLAKIKEILA